MHLPNDWENPQVVAINKRPGHTRTVSYNTAEQALSGNHTESPYYQLAEWNLAVPLSAQSRLRS